MILRGLCCRCLGGKNSGAHLTNNCFWLTFNVSVGLTSRTLCRLPSTISLFLKHDILRLLQLWYYDFYCWNGWLREGKSDLSNQVSSADLLRLNIINLSWEYRHVISLPKWSYTNWNPTCPSASRPEGKNFIKGREVSLPMLLRSTCFISSLSIIVVFRYNG